MMYYIVSVLFLLFFWCPCMAIDVSLQYNGGLLLDIMLIPSGNPFKYREEILYLQPLIPPKRFGIFSSMTGGCSEGLGAF